MISVSLPPLRERKEDIGELAGHFMRKYSAEFRDGTKTLSPDGVISAEDAAEKTRGGGRSPEKDADEGAQRRLHAMLEDADPSSRNVYREIIGTLEKKLVAQILGINRNTLSRKIGGSQ